MMRRLRRADGIDCDLDIAVGAVLETDGTTGRREFTMIWLSVVRAPIAPHTPDRRCTAA